MEHIVGEFFALWANQHRSLGRKLIDCAKAIVAKIKATFSSRKARDAASQEAFGKDLAPVEKALKAWEEAYAEGQKAVKNAPVRQGTGEGKPRNSVSAAENTFAGPKITAGISDSERTSILQNKVISAPVYSGQGDIAIARNEDDLDSRKRSLAEAALVKIGEEFGVYTEYRNADLHIEVYFSKGSLKESAHKAIDDRTQLARLMPLLSKSVENAIGIETHDNRYYSDDQTMYFHELLGGYIDGDSFVPVRFGVKEFKNGACTLYVVVCQEKIKTEVLESEHIDKSSGDPDSRSVNIRVADIAANVKTPDLLRYLPDGLLNKEQIATKYEALAETVRYTNSKNDKAYAEAIARGDMVAVQRIVDRAAKMAGLNDNSGERWWHFGDFATPASNSYVANALHIGTKTAAENRAKDIRSDIDSMNVNAFNVEKYESRKAKYSASATQPFYADIDIDSVIDVMRSEDVGSDENWQKVISEARKYGYKAIRYNNLYEDPGSVSLIVIDPKILKSAEPITYDDNGNVIPISQRFDTGKDDIRYSLSGEDILAEAEERAAAEQEVFDQFDAIREGMAKGKVVMPSSVEKLANDVIRSWGADMDSEDIMHPLQTALDAAIRAKGVDKIYNAYDELVAVGRTIAENIVEVEGDIFREYSQLRKELRDYHIYVGPEIVADIADYFDTVRPYRNRLKLTTRKADGAVTIDQAFHDLQEGYPWLFTPATAPTSF